MIYFCLFFLLIQGIGSFILFNHYLDLSEKVEELEDTIADERKTKTRILQTIVNLEDKHNQSVEYFAKRHNELNEDYNKIANDIIKELKKRGI